MIYIKENQIKLEQSVASQKEVIAQQKEDFETILNANKELTELKAKLDKELDALDDKFNKTNASGKKEILVTLQLQSQKLYKKLLIEQVTTSRRCVEIAMGSPLTEKEQNATKKSEINSECPSIANPNYILLIVQE